jgi:hypothetical protein
MLPNYMIGHLFAHYDTVPNTTMPLVVIVVVVVGDDGAYNCVTHTLSLSLFLSTYPLTPFPLHE